MPVGEDDRLIGVITDRDIAVRAVAHSLNPETPARQVGIVSIGDVAKKTAPRTTGDALAAISRTGGAHDQTVH